MHRQILRHFHCKLPDCFVRISLLSMLIHLIHRHYFHLRFRNIHKSEMHLTHQAVPVLTDIRELMFRRLRIRKRLHPHQQFQNIHRHILRQLQIECHLLPVLNLRYLSFPILFQKGFRQILRRLLHRLYFYCHPHKHHLR